MWSAVLGTKVPFSSAAVLNTPTLFELKAATYSVAPSALTASPVGVARLLSFSVFGTGAQHLSLS